MEKIDSAVCCEFSRKFRVVSGLINKRSGSPRLPRWRRAVFDRISVCKMTGRELVEACEARAEYGTVAPVFSAASRHARAGRQTPWLPVGSRVPRLLAGPSFGVLRRM